jgi:hypothetical protein
MQKTGSERCASAACGNMNEDMFAPIATIRKYFHGVAGKIASAAAGRCDQRSHYATKLAPMIVKKSTQKRREKAKRRAAKADTASRRIRCGDQEISIRLLSDSAPDIQVRLYTSSKRTISSSPR